MNNQPMLNSLWDRVKAIYLTTLFSEDDKSKVNRLFSLVTRAEEKDGKLKVFTANSYAAEMLTTNHIQKLKSCMVLAGSEGDITIEEEKVEVPPNEEIHSLTPVSAQPIYANQPIASKATTFVSTMPLNEDYTFDKFVKGPSNSFAFSAAKAVVENPGKTGYNPLFIHGGTGLGKTHLMQAIGNELKRKDPSLSICYLTAEQFLNEYVNYMQKNSLNVFRNKYRSVDVLLLDDVQFFQRGKDIQEEYFNTFNALQQAKKQIVMTSDVAPKYLPAIETRLISRFEGGFVQEVESPSYETRLAILNKKKEDASLNVDNNVLEFIAYHIKSHVRAMEGALSKVAIFLASEPNLKLDNNILTYLLKDSIEKEQTLKRLTIEEIQGAVAKKYNVTLSQILSSERTQTLVTPRQIAMYISRKFTVHSLPEIAKSFDKSHATVIHGVKTIEKRMEVEPELKASIADILSSFGYQLTDEIAK